MLLPRSRHEVQPWTCRSPPSEGALHAAHTQAQAASRTCPWPGSWAALSPGVTQTFVREVGKGSIGRVHLGHWRETSVAIKSLATVLEAQQREHQRTSLKADSEDSASPGDKEARRTGLSQVSRRMHPRLPYLTTMDALAWQLLLLLLLPPTCLDAARVKQHLEPAPARAHAHAGACRWERKPQGRRQAACRHRAGQPAGQCAEHAEEPGARGAPEAAQLGIPTADPWLACLSLSLCDAGKPCLTAVWQSMLAASCLWRWQQHMINPGMGSLVPAMPLSAASTTQPSTLC